MWKCKHIQGLCGNLVSIPSVSSTQSYRISGLDQEPVNPPTVGNTTLSPVQVENPACVNVPGTCHHHPPQLLRLAQVSVTPGTHPWNPGVLPQEYTTQKTHQESPFPPSSKGEGRKSVQGFERSWSMVVAAQIPSESWGSLLQREQRGCQTNSGNSSHEKQGKATGKRLLHQTDFSISSPGSTGSCHRNKIREREMRRWDLSPAILLLFPADWDCKSPSYDSSMRWIGTWFWQLQAWQTETWAGPVGAVLPKRWLEKKTKGEGAEVLVLHGLYAEEPSAGCGECSPRSSARWGELSTLLFPLSGSAGWAWGTPGITSLPGLCCWRLLKEHLSGARTERGFMAMVLGGSEWASRDREYLRIRDTQTPVWSRRSPLHYQHISPKERQEIIWETEDHV